MQKENLINALVRDEIVTIPQLTCHVVKKKKIPVFIVLNFEWGYRKTS